MLEAYSLSKIISSRLNWKIEKTPDSNIVLLINYKTGERLVANRPQLFGFLYEDWDYQYVPTKIEGKRVLDIGAGWGETAYFFRNHGYEVAVGIENDPVNVSCLRTNAINHRWRFEIIGRGFNINDLKELAPSYDFVKMDIEGAETVLLNLDVLPPIILETHCPLVTAKFIAKFAGLSMKSHRKNTAILSNIG